MLGQDSKKILSISDSFSLSSFVIHLHEAVQNANDVKNGISLFHSPTHPRTGEGAAAEKKGIFERLRKCEKYSFGGCCCHVESLREMVKLFLPLSFSLVFPHLLKSSKVACHPASVGHHFFLSLLWTFFSHLSQPKDLSQKSENIPCARSRFAHVLSRAQHPRCWSSNRQFESSKRSRGSQSNVSPYQTRVETG